MACALHQFLSLVLVLLLIASSFHGILDTTITNAQESSSASASPLRADMRARTARGPDHKLVSIALKAAARVVHESKVLANACLRRGPEERLHVLEIQAIEDCSALMDNAHDQLDRAITQIFDGLSDPPRPSDLLLVPSRRQSPVTLALYESMVVWLSAALSFQTTCSDGFHFVRSGKCEATILRAQERVSQVLVNSLDVVKKMAMNAREEEEEEEEMMIMVGHGRGRGGGHGFIRHRGNVTKRKPAHHPACNDQSFPGHSNIRTEVNSSDMIPCLHQAPVVGSGASPDVIVAQDGSGHYKNITDALKSIINNGSMVGRSGRLVVYIKRGVYNESFEVPKTLPNLTFLGDGINVTIITGNKNVGSGLFNTLRTSTVGIIAEGFMARDITFQNTAGPLGYQAVALRVEGDMAVFYRCSFEGYQDTLYALAGRQFYRDCLIYGTVDFIFGNAIASFQSCQLLARKPLQGQENTLTAQGRRVAEDISGFSFQNCTLVASNDLMLAPFRVRTYLGRPWKPYSRAIFLQSFLDNLIDPSGWLSWNSSNPYTETVYYAEFQNRGPGSPISNRVSWLGVHPSLNSSEALQFTADNFILGSTWLPLTQISYTSGLSSDPQH